MSDTETTGVVFLDFDGVIRLEVPGAWTGIQSSNCFMEEPMKLLASFLEARPGTKIVISSFWRCDPLEDIKKHLHPHLTPYLHEDWKTSDEAFDNYEKGIVEVVSRSAEVLEWLSRHPEVEHYVIIDDCPGLFSDPKGGIPPEVSDHLVITDAAHGITESDIVKAQQVYKLPRKHVPN